MEKDGPVYGLDHLGLTGLVGWVYLGVDLCESIIKKKEQTEREVYSEDRDTRKWSLLGRDKIKGEECFGEAGC